MDGKSKAETFVGFAVRAGKFRIGTNAVMSLKKANLVLVCRTASDNTKNQAVKIAKKFNCKLLITKDKTLSDMTHKENAKVMAITDFALAKAITDNSVPEFTDGQEIIYG